jgi:hypothetical protein
MYEYFPCLGCLLECVCWYSILIAYSTVKPSCMVSFGSRDLNTEPRQILNGGSLTLRLVTWEKALNQGSLGGGWGPTVFTFSLWWIDTDRLPMLERVYCLFFFEKWKCFPRITGKWKINGYIQFMWLMLMSWMKYYVCYFKIALLAKLLITAQFL